MKPDQMPSLMKAMQICNSESIFIEIGTWEGVFSDTLLKSTNCKKLYCVDPYKHFANNEYPDAINDLTQEQYDNVFLNTNKNLSTKYGERVEFIRLESVNASKMFENNSVDFVYIDGNHDYKYVDADIKAWYPKIKSGGYLCGDDIYSQNMQEHDSENNILKVWSKNVNGLPISWGKYGTYPACIHNETVFNTKFLFEETQFSCFIN